MQGRGYFGYPPMPPFYVGYYFPEDPTGQHGRGRGRMPPHPPPMYFPGPVPPTMMHHAPMHQQHPPAQSSGLQVRRGTGSLMHRGRRVRGREGGTGDHKAAGGGYGS